ncbi:glycoside hydrolase family 5 protein [Punctularia strigosozonata HHB-11173 SS5]|uniref:glycoside hydrolase family 5 protein n=1 Tax=Punctularia strigosozonata (strain HHB-11173) TaxID=741275 RepID=UPI000441752F|nr:glycoside hydrolase family 5 protein [Punctularia strigosozonata HHB-11173 SS5]EIN11009.1 glycoside hydrolase family 5 protein [Punctularia strigosozonata HHB-11173 SS5]
MFISMRRIAATLLSALFIPRVLADVPISNGFKYGTDKVYGVNLGGWLVLEPWITPSLFDSTGDSRIVDEWTFGQYQSKAMATAALQAHWATWITESDFADIAAAGLNHVRLPIGYWAWDVSEGEPYIQGQLPYLSKAVTWAGNHGLKLIVDLHGAPGSQNGFDNSGRRISYPEWHTNSDNVDRTTAIIKKLANMFKDQANVVTTIAPLNEPAGFYGDDVLTVLKQYWHDSYGNIRFPYGSAKQGNNLVLLHDAFQDLSYWDGFMPSPDYQGVALDTHQYQIFSDAEVARSNADHINVACAKGSSFSSFSKSQLWLIVGEWTPAATDCAKYLNGKGVGARYDGSYTGSPKIGSCTGKTGSASSFSSSYKTWLRQYWEAQAITYSKGAGWIQWTWKAENADDWTYQAGLKGGWIPQSPTDYKYPTICG